MDYLTTISVMHELDGNSSLWISRRRPVQVSKPHVMARSVRMSAALELLDRKKQSEGIAGGSGAGQPSFPYWNNAAEVLVRRLSLIF
jgi:hypothetical protein